MALKKEMLVATFGAPVTIHRIDSITISPLTKTTSVSVSSFCSTVALAQSLNPLAQVTVQLDGIPANGQGAVEFAESALAAAAPEGVNVDPVIQQYSADRYAFAGAEVLDL